MENLFVQTDMPGPIGVTHSQEGDWLVCNLQYSETSGSITSQWRQLPDGTWVNDFLPQPKPEGGFQVCPKCNGEKYVFEFDGISTAANRPCGICAGTGLIDKIHGLPPVR